MFKIANYDINTFASTGWGSIKVNVTGYWSDVITIYVRHGVIYGSNDWNVEISHSSGGRDTDAVKEDYIAEYNFGHALIAACAEARKILENVDVLNASYEAYRAERKAIADKEKQEKQDFFNADQIIGLDAAKTIVKNIKKAGGNVVIPFHKRGEKFQYHIEVSRRSNIGFYVYDKKMSVTDIINVIASASVRSVDLMKYL